MSESEGPDLMLYSELQVPAAVIVELLFSTSRPQKLALDLLSPSVQLAKVYLKVEWQAKTASEQTGYSAEQKKQRRLRRLLLLENQNRNRKQKDCFSYERALRPQEKPRHRTHCS